MSSPTIAVPSTSSTLASKYKESRKFTPGCGDPTGKDVDIILPDGAEKLLPAQKETILTVLAEKVTDLEKGATYSIEVWKSPQGDVYIQDGQHRFIGACVAGKEITLLFKKLGAKTFDGKWKDTAHSKATPAKEILKNNMSKKV
jgi:hypothetical protein